MTKLIVGLGNPGLRYRNTRHNAGFLVINEISRELGIPVKRKKYNGFFGKKTLNGGKIALLMPQTYMNLSGESIRKAVRQEGVDFEDFLVICDDLNLKFGFIRLRTKGSSGGHNGLESAIETLGTNEFPRLRVGIGKDHALGDVVRFVLRPFDSLEKKQLLGVVKLATRCAVTWARDGADLAMTEFNKRQ